MFTWTQIVLMLVGAYLLVGLVYLYKSREALQLFRKQGLPRWATWIAVIHVVTSWPFGVAMGVRITLKTRAKFAILHEMQKMLIELVDEIKQQSKKHIDSHNLEGIIGVIKLLRKAYELLDRIDFEFKRLYQQTEAELEEEGLALGDKIRSLKRDLAQLQGKEVQ